MPQSNPSGTNQLSSHTPTQAFLENLFLGANLKQREKEIEAANNVSAQEQVLNEQAIQRNEQLMAAAANQAMLESFNQEQGFRNDIALGTIPSDFEGSRGQVFDVSKMLPGQPPVMHDIEYGKYSAKDYKGETVSVDSNEKRQREKAVGKQIELTEQESIAKQAGSLLLQEIGAQNTAALEQYRGEQDLYREQYRHANAVALQKMRDATQLQVARINKTPIAGSSVRMPEEYEYGIRGLMDGSKDAVQLKREGFAPDEIKQMGMAISNSGGRVLSTEERKAITKDRELSANFRFKLEKFKDLTAKLSNSDDQNLASLRGNLEEARAFVGFPSELYREFLTLKADILEQAAQLNQGRPTDKDADAAAFSNINMKDTNSLNQKKINEFALRFLETKRSKYNVSDGQFDLMFAGTDLEGIAALREEFQRPLDETFQAAKQQKQQLMDEARQFYLSNPDFLRKKGLTLEKALELEEQEINAELGLGEE